MRNAASGRQSPERRNMVNETENRPREQVEALLAEGDAEHLLRIFPLSSRIGKFQESPEKSGLSSLPWRTSPIASKRRRRCRKASNVFERSWKIFPEAFLPMTWRGG